MCNISMGVINMLSSLTVTIVVIIALFISNRTNKLQKESIQANTFDSITKRINDLLSKMPSEDKRSKASHWYIMILNAFDYFSFFANRNYFNPDMASYYKGYIVSICDNLKNNCPAAITYLQESSQTSTLCELKKYYKRHTGKVAPI